VNQNNVASVELVQCSEVALHRANYTRFRDSIEVKNDYKNENSEQQYRVFVRTHRYPSRAIVIFVVLCSVVRKVKTTATSMVCSTPKNLIRIRRTSRGGLMATLSRSDIQVIGRLASLGIRVV
jgi:hypothetical protein